MNPSDIKIVAGEHCPSCGHYTSAKIKPEKGNCLFIGSFEATTGTIFADAGIICDAFVCNNCGNIQLKARNN